MRTRLLPLLATLPLVVVLTACDSDDSGHGDDRAGRAPNPTFAFDRDLGCGYGFARADEDGETLLRLSRGPDTGAVERQTTLPDDGWTAEVTVGEHLTANWCSDVIMDPQPEVDETWAVVAGTLTFQGAVPKDDDVTDGSTPVRARLTGVVVESPEGERVSLDDMDLVNDTWGLLPG